ncbi:UNVERIFIED_CONTAM: hypothetical protein HDU68_006552, partial [Siphonaria sp. JEL0065]
YGHNAYNGDHCDEARDDHLAYIQCEYCHEYGHNAYGGDHCDEAYVDHLVASY